MIMAAVAYTVGFLLAWWTARSMLPWAALAWIGPLVWVVGLGGRSSRLLALGLAVGLAVAAWAAWPEGRYLSLSGTVVLLWSWDVGMLAIRLSRAGPVEDRWMLWRAQLLRASGVGVVALAAGVGLSSLRLDLPFWPLAGLLLAIWVALGWLHRQAAAVHGAGAAPNGNRSSSWPPGTG